MQDSWKAGSNTSKILLPSSRIIHAMGEELCEKEVVPCQLSRYTRISKSQRFEDTEWTSLIFEGDTCDTNLLIRADEANSMANGLETEENKIPRTNWFVGNEWKECMSLQDGQTVIQYQTDVANEYPEAYRKGGQILQHLNEERDQRELALLFVGGGKCAVIERQSDKRCRVVSAGEFQIRVSDICMDCTANTTEERKRKRDAVRRQRDNLIPFTVVDACLHEMRATHLLGLTEGCMWIKANKANIDYLLEYRLV